VKLQLKVLSNGVDLYNFNNKPVTLGTDEILREWIKFRKSCIKRGIEFDISKQSQTLHLLKGLEKVLVDIDKAIKIIRYSESDNKIISDLMNEFSIDEPQANEIANMKLRNINQSYILSKIKNIKDLENDMHELRNTLTDDKKISNIIINDLQRVKKLYGKPRQTEVLYEYEVSATVIKEEIPDYNCMYYITEEYYIKKIPLTSLRASTAEHKLKEGDKIVTEISGSNLSDILVFSSVGVCYKIKGYNLNDSKVSTLGDYLPSVLNLDKGEYILKVIITNDYSGDMLFAFGNGKIARVYLKSYETKTNRSKLVNAFSTESKIVNILHLDEDIELLCKSSINKVLIINTSEIDAKNSKSSQGVFAMRQKLDSVMDLCVPYANTSGIHDADDYRGTVGAVGNSLSKVDHVNSVVQHIFSLEK
jgi:DNA gyrase subunit A